MPLTFLEYVIFHKSWDEIVEYVRPYSKYVIAITILILLKLYFRGSRNRYERDMHGRVVLVLVRRDG